MFSTVEIGVSFWQFASNALRIPDLLTPEEWSKVRDWLGLFELNLDVLRAIFPDFDDPRVYFIALCVLVPLGFIFCGLVFLNPLSVMMWYALLVLGTCLTTAGLYSRVVGSVANLSFTGNDVLVQVMAYVGIFIILLCVLLFFLRHKLPFGHGPKSEADTIEEQREEETEAFPVAQSLQLLIIVAVFALLATFMLTDYLDFFDRGSLVVAGQSLTAFKTVTGSVAAVLAGAFGTWLLFSLFHCGRRLQWSLLCFLTRYFMRALLLSMAIAYIPVGTGIILMFNCADETCPTGQRFVEYGSGLPHNISDFTKQTCIACSVPATQHCPLALQQRSGCLGVQQDPRLESDRRISCSSMQRFYWPAAAVAGVLYLAGVPLLFFYLIHLTSRLVIDEFPVRQLTSSGEELGEEELYELKNRDSDHVAKFLHEPYLSTQRFTRLYQTLHKLFVVFMTVFIIRVDGSNGHVKLALGATLGLHTLALVWFVVWRPYAQGFENVAAVVMQVCLILTVVAALLIQLDVVAFPAWALYAILVLDVALPIIATFIGVALEWSRRRQSAEELEEEERRRVEEELRRMAESSSSSDDDSAMDSPIRTPQVQSPPASPRKAAAEPNGPLFVKRQPGPPSEKYVVTVDAPRSPSTRAFRQPAVSPRARAVEDAGRRSPGSAMVSIALPVPQLAPGARSPRSPRSSDGASPRSDAVAALHWSPHLAFAPGTSPAPSPKASPRPSPRVGPAAADVLKKRQSRLTRAERRVLKRVKAEAEARVAEEAEREAAQLASEQRACDQRINNLVRHRLSVALMAMGLLAFIALAFAVVGLREQQSSEPLPYTTSDASLRGELAGYHGWSNFTAACCCSWTEGTRLPPYLLAERWQCANGLVKERLRAVRRAVGNTTVDVDGFALRSVCGMAFAAGCGPQVLGNDTVIFTCSSPPAGLSNEDVQALW